MTKQPTPDDFAEADRRADRVMRQTPEAASNCYRTALATAIATEPSEADRTKAAEVANSISRGWGSEAPRGEDADVIRLLRLIAGPEPVDPNAWKLEAAERFARVSFRPDYQDTAKAAFLRGIEAGLAHKEQQP